MQYGMDSKILVVKLVNGEDVFRAIEDATRKYNIRSGIILGGIGMLRDFELGYFEPGGYKTKVFDKPHELVSMTGSIAYSKTEPHKFLPHIHCTLADSEHKMFGGHLYKGTVNVINEITILQLDKLKLTRIKNETTGLMELNIEPNEN
jgi:predicted DNA-binding protein with PD1-like motif